MEKIPDWYKRIQKLHPVLTSFLEDSGDKWSDGYYEWYKKCKKDVQRIIQKNKIKRGA